MCQWVIAAKGAVLVLISQLASSSIAKVTQQYELQSLGDLFVMAILADGLRLR